MIKMCSTDIGIIYMFVFSCASPISLVVSLSSLLILLSLANYFLEYVETILFNINMKSVRIIY